MNIVFKFILASFLALSLNSCFISDVASATLKTVGGVVSVVPVVGDAIDETLETVADAVEVVPL